MDKPINRLDGLPVPARILDGEVRTAFAAGKLAEAERAITLMLAYAPKHPEPHRLMGLFLQRTGRPTEGAKSLRQADSLRRDDPDILVALGVTLIDAGDFAAAIEPLKRAVEIRPTAETHFRYGQALQENALLESAVIVFERAVEVDPKHALARLQYARNLFYTGNSEEAAKQFRLLIASGEDPASAWYGLAEMKTVAFTADDLAVLKKLRNDPLFTGLHRATLLHAVGKAYEDAGDFAAAYEAFADAARIEHETVPLDREGFDSYIDSVRAAFPEPIRNPDEQGREAIFIIGMPRAGTTLVEQILAAHSQVEGASELPDLTLVIHRESQRYRQHFPEWVARTTAQDWRRMGAEYLDTTARWRSRKPRFTDKSPGNWMTAEAAIAMLPNARFVNVRRDPVETCWSCFRQFFSPGRMPWASSFDDIADYLRRCYDQCDFLAARYPGNVRIQSYEKLVDDPQGQTRELLAFCGLDFEAACLRFHETERTIRTASAAQVRKPIARSPNHAERYGALLDPLRDALRRAGVEV